MRTTTKTSRCVPCVAVLGESLPSNTSALHMWLGSWSCILLGVVAISGVTVDDLPVSAAVTAAGEVVTIFT